MSMYWSDEDGGGETKHSEDDNKPEPATTTTINSGRWTREEHDKFLEGLQNYGKEWKKIAELIQTRTVVQIRTHAQKYFQKVAKNTGGPVMSTSKKGHIVRPPARKRKNASASEAPDTSTLQPPAPGPVDLQPPSYRKPNSIQVPPQRTFNRLSKKAPTKDEKDTGGATPRTVAAATILLRPRLQQKLQSGGDTPKTRQTAAWLAANQAQAAAVLAKRKRTGQISGRNNANTSPSSSEKPKDHVVHTAPLSWGEAVANQ